MGGKYTQGVYHGREIYPGCVPGYVLPYVLPGVYHPMYTLCTPWVYHGVHCSCILPGTLSPPAAVREEEALGSNPGIIREKREMRRIELLLLLRKVTVLMRRVFRSSRDKVRTIG